MVTGPGASFLMTHKGIWTAYPVTSGPGEVRAIVRYLSRCQNPCEFTGVQAMLADLSGAGHYVSWSIFTISVANLVVVAIMLLVFFLALVVPFPRGTAVTVAPSK